MALRGVKYYGVPPASGYGIAAEAYISCLLGAGVPTTWHPLIGTEATAEDPFGVRPYRWSGSDPDDEDFSAARHRELIGLDIPYDAVVIHSPPRRVEPWLDEAPGVRVVSYSAWETDRLPKSWVPVLNSYDAVLVPSTFNAEVYRSSGVDVPIHVVPHVAPAPYAEPPVPRHLASIPPVRYGDIDDEFVFYNVSTWTTRKAIPDTVTAFLRAFPDQEATVPKPDGLGFAVDDRAVGFVLKTTDRDLMAVHRLARRVLAGKISEDEIPAYAVRTWYALAALRSGETCRSKMHLNTNGAESANTVAALHARGDCMVSLTRGEGFGLTVLEAAIHGTPVVVPGWSGYLDFLPPDYPYLVDFEMAPVADDPADGWMTGDAKQQWARADVDHAARIMRAVAADPDAAAGVGRELQAYASVCCSEASIAAALLAALDRLD